ncbi:BQ2448_8073 [Microbotryum intermedium]|uniref:BQ2448_8073 protein n=1 Tax=Microbotryum intermedium TaxID=269621 RepID=A0A238FRD7_9BASI|nr:BQ2448_8073 [Microbotryum intermedium]
MLAHYSTRTFNLDVAKAFILFSAMVYLRNDQHHDPDGIIVNHGNDEWELNYRTVLTLIGGEGASAGVFYSKSKVEQPFMVLVFKGTTPTNYSEFLVDCNLRRTSAIPFFGAGTMHEGFARHLLRMRKPGGGLSQDGYGQVLHGLAEINATIKAEQPAVTRVPLWVTGHSLGGGLAALFFARALKSPDDLGNDLELRDCYNFGAPRTGDANFAETVTGEMINSICRPNVLWRVQNRSELIRRLPLNTSIFSVPLRYASQFASRSVLNYRHVGIRFVLDPKIGPERGRVNTESLYRETPELSVQETMALL